MILLEDTTAQLIHAFVTSRLDGCNSLLLGLPGRAIMKLQRVQNMEARLIKRKYKYDCVTIDLQDRAIMCVTGLFSRLPFSLSNVSQYLCGVLREYTPACSLRSQNASLLIFPKSGISTGERAFASSATRLWNNLPIHLRQIERLCTFKNIT